MPATKPSAGSFNILSITSQTEGRENYLNMTYQIVSGLPLNATVVVTPVDQVPDDLPVYVFYDLDYPTVATDWIFSAMLQDHLDAELRLRGYSNDPKLVNATELENILVNNETAILIMASGGFPSNVFSNEVNLVKPWIDSGGILVWFGFDIGYYSLEKGMKEEDITWNMTQNPQENGSKMLGLGGFFEYTTNDTPTFGVYPSPLCSALDVTYDLIQQAPLLQMVWDADGLALGKIGGPNTFRLRSSVSMIPVGSGKIIIFGFFLTQSMADDGPELAARDIAQILCSGVLLMNTSSIPWYQSYDLSKQGSINGNCSLPIGPDVVGFEVLEYTSRNSDGILFRRQFVNAAGQNG